MARQAMIPKYGGYVRPEIWPHVPLAHCYIYEEEERTDGQITLWVVALFGGGRDGIESDVGEEYEGRPGRVTTARITVAHTGHTVEEDKRDR